MRVFLDTKSDHFRLVLAQGVVARTLVPKVQHRGTDLEIDVTSDAEVIEVRLKGMSELFTQLMDKP